MKSIKKMEREVDNITAFLLGGTLAVCTIVLFLLILNFIINIICGAFLSG